MARLRGDLLRLMSCRCHFNALLRLLIYTLRRIIFQEGRRLSGVRTVKEFAEPKIHVRRRKDDFEDRRRPRLKLPHSAAAKNSLFCEDDAKARTLASAFAIS